MAKVAAKQSAVLTDKQVHDLNMMNVAAQNVKLGDMLKNGVSGGGTGTAAGFGTPTATIDANTGTPEVTVEASGPDTAKVFAFTFKNLKGAKGDKGDKGDTGAAGASYTLPAATTSALGGVKQSAAVPEAAGENVTKAEFKALLDALKTAGIMANS